MEARQLRGAEPQRANPEATAAFPPLPTPRAPSSAPDTARDLPRPARDLPPAWHDEMAKRAQQHAAREAFIQSLALPPSPAPGEGGAQGGVDIVDDATVNIVDDATVNIVDDATVNIVDDATVNIVDDATVNIVDDATVTIVDDATVTIIGGTTLNTVEATTVHADDDAMNIVENAPIPALGQVACLPTVRRESARLKARRQPS